MLRSSAGSTRDCGTVGSSPRRVPRRLCGHPLCKASAHGSSTPRILFLDAFAARHPSRCSRFRDNEGVVTEEIGSLVQRADRADPEATRQLFAALYHELHHLAEQHLRRAGGLVTLGDAEATSGNAVYAVADLERLADALDELAGLNDALAELVDLHFFCGFSLGEIAAMRQVSERTVQRDWRKARMLLQHALLDDRPLPNDEP